ncbi:MAG TPA: ABC transporter ATP-binding protein [Baekduia sp.]|jgi:ABC-type nitrate/sulfonate/bicarbonate transport system ATPase subunit
MSVPATHDVPQGTRAPDSARLLSIADLEFAYPDGLVAVRGLDLDLQPGEVVSVVGPSGCGKSTLLSVLSGMKAAKAGRVDWNESLLADTVAERGGERRKPRRRRLSLVFQRDTVLPWKTVEDNVALGLNYVSITKEEREERITSLLRLAKMEDFRGAYPKQLSGGMRRRVALLTGVAPLPHLVLLDEPFAALDEPTRVAVHADLLEIVYRLGLAVILVTHDIAEALTLSDRVVILTNRPARVAKIVETGFGRDRDIRALRETPAFQRMYGETWHELWKQAEIKPADRPTDRGR